MTANPMNFFEFALVNVDQGVVIYDDNLIVIGFNRQAMEILAVPPGTFAAGQPFAKLVRHVAELGRYGGQGSVEARVEKRMAIARSFAPYAAEQRRDDGKIVAVVGKPLPGVGYVVTYTDATERKAAEQAAKENEQRFRDFAEMGSDWFWEMGPDLRFIYHSPRYFEITGFRPEDKIGTTRTQYVDPASLKVDPEKWAAHLADLEARRPFHNFEYAFVVQDGRQISARISGLPMFDADGGFLGYRGIGTDITEMVENARALKVSDDQFRAFIDSLPAFVNLKDRDGHYLLINRRHSEVFGFHQQRIFGKVISELLPEREADDAALQEREVLETKSVVTREREIQIDGKTGAFLVTKFPVLGEDGEVARIGTIGTEITQLKEAQSGLLAAKAEAEAANRSKSDFLAAMSHDLRTPLNAIIGFADAISLQYFGAINDKYQEYAQDIRWSGEHLLALIGDILDVTAIEAGKLEMRMEELAVGEVVAECVKIIKGEARALAIDLSIDMPSQLPPLRADRQAVKEILLNLLANAIKFTPRDGTATLAVTAAGDSHVITVRDTGVGIAEDRIGTITEPFVRGSADPYRSQNGVGLGLAIVNSLVESLDGTLAIASAVGEGTTVTVTLPSIGGAAQKQAAAASAS